MLDALFGQAAPAAIGAARDQQRVFEAGGSEKAHARSIAGKDDVVDYGRAVQEQAGRTQQIVERRTSRGGRTRHRVEDALAEMRRCGKCLSNMDALTGAENDAVRAC